MESVEMESVEMKSVENPWAPALAPTPAQATCPWLHAVIPLGAGDWEGPHLPLLHAHWGASGKQPPNTVLQRRPHHHHHLDEKYIRGNP